MNDVEFKEMTAENLPEVLEIYNYYVLNSTATFNTNPLTPEEMSELVFSKNTSYRTFVIIENGNLCGYVMATQFKKREAYDSTAEATVYLKPEYTGKGIGDLAVKYIEEYALTQGFHVLIALICGENTQSLSVFEKNGYEKCAHYNEVGKKFGRWLDLVAYQKIIG